MTFKNLTLMAVGALILNVASSASAQQPALLLTNGNIVTLDSNDTIASSVLIRNGRIAAVGDELPENPVYIHLRTVPRPCCW